MLKLEASLPLSYSFVTSPSYSYLQATSSLGVRPVIHVYNLTVRVMPMQLSERFI